MNAASRWVPVSEAMPLEDVDVLLWWGPEFPCDVGLWFGRGWQKANGNMEEYDAPPTHWAAIEPPRDECARHE